MISFVFSTCKNAAQANKAYETKVNTANDGGAVLFPLMPV